MLQTGEDLEEWSTSQLGLVITADDPSRSGYYLTDTGDASLDKDYFCDLGNFLCEDVSSIRIQSKHDHSTCQCP